MATWKAWYVSIFERSQVLSSAGEAEKNQDLSILAIYRSKKIMNS